MTKKIVLTGGGTAGHVTPNIALIERLKKEGWSCYYIGSNNSIEQSLMSELSVPFSGIATGKLRRYFSLQNFIDPFKIVFGLLQSIFFLRRIKPNIAFSKGGFVSLPVVVAAWLCKIPVIAHESDLSPGLTTKLSLPFVHNLCVSFERAKRFFKDPSKLVVSGSPIRSALFCGDKGRAFELCQFKSLKPCLMFAGGGLGSIAINDVVRKSLDRLLLNFNVIHLCGKGKADFSIDKEGYCQFEYVNEEMPDLYALADIVISRSGANTVCEVLALSKPHIFIPLSLKASRGDQIHNANYCQELGISFVLDENDLNVKVLCQLIDELILIKDERSHKIKALNFGSGTDIIIDLIKKVAH